MVDLVTERFSKTLYYGLHSICEEERSVVVTLLVKLKASLCEAGAVLSHPIYSIVSLTLTLICTCLYSRNHTGTHESRHIGERKRDADTTQERRCSIPGERE